MSSSMVTLTTNIAAIRKLVTECGLAGNTELTKLLSLYGQLETQRSRKDLSDFLDQVSEQTGKLGELLPDSVFDRVCELTTEIHSNYF